METEMRGNRKKQKKTLRRSGKAQELHCMRVRGEESMLFPTTILEEVVDFTPPEPLPGAPSWLLGEVEWSNRQVPVFDFQALLHGEDPEQPNERWHIMVIKSLNEDGRVPYVGLVMEELPAPTLVKEDMLKETEDDKRGLGVYCRANLDGMEVIIPDVDRLTHLVTHAAFGALPITQLDD